MYIVLEDHRGSFAVYGGTLIDNEQRAAQLKKNSVFIFEIPAGKEEAAIKAAKDVAMARTIKGHLAEGDVIAALLTEGVIEPGGSHVFPGVANQVLISNGAGGVTVAEGFLSQTSLGTIFIAKSPDPLAVDSGMRVLDSSDSPKLQIIYNESADERRLFGDGPITVNGTVVIPVSSGDHYTLPSEAGLDGQMLRINSTGVVEWIDVEDVVEVYPVGMCSNVYNITNALFFQRITVTRETRPMTEMRFFCTNNGGGTQVSMGIYDEVGVRLDFTGLSNTIVAGDNVIPLTNQNVSLSPGTYYLSLAASGGVRVSTLTSTTYNHAPDLPVCFSTANPFAIDASGQPANAATFMGTGNSQRIWIQARA